MKITQIPIPDFLKRTAVLVQIVLILIATGFLTYNITRPFVDYDEAIYAKVIVDTIKSGDIWSFSFSGHPFLEKPPLYFWSVIASTKIFGFEEWVFRLPSVLASIICLWMVYLLVWEFTKNRYAAVLAFLILLFSPPFYFLATEARLDPGVLAAILVTLFLFIRGWKKEIYLFWVLPVIAMGFLIKSVIVFLVVPILLMYSFAYREWGWVRSRIFWAGSLLALLIFLPWHILEALKYGKDFWDSYIFHQVFQRATSTITGSSDYLFYVKQLWRAAPLWSCVYATIIVIFTALCFLKTDKSRMPWKEIVTPLAAALLILGVFSLASTRLSSYVLPMYPFFAIFAGVFFHQLSQVTWRLGVATFTLALLIIFGFHYTFSPAFAPISYEYDEMRIGQVYNENKNISSAPLYSFGWWKLDTMNYYGDTNVIHLDRVAPAVNALKAPFYFAITVPDAQHIFFDRNGELLSQYKNFKLIYRGQYLVLVYSIEDLKIH